MIYRKFVLFLLLSAMLGCAGRPSVTPLWDTTPEICNHPATSACTPLPQELGEDFRVEAGFKASPSGEPMQYYRLITAHPKYAAILVHGVLGGASNFRRQFSQPVSQLNLMAFDRPGYGRSPNKSDNATFAFQASTIQRFLDDEKALPVILVGHSYGGALALKIAVDNPKKVRGLLLINAALEPRQSEAHSIQSFFESLGFVPPFLKQTNSELIRLKEGLQSFADRISNLNLPIEVLHGTIDDVVPVSHAEYFKKRMESAGKGSLVNVETCAGCGHRMIDQNPELVAKALERLKRRLK